MGHLTKNARLHVRPVRDSDLGQLIGALEPEVSAAQVTQRLQESCHGHRDMLVAELDGRAVGTVSMGGHGFQRPDSLRLFALDVGKALRRQGIGTALVEAVESVASARALGEVNLEVAIYNKDAIRRYERLGYRRHGNPIMDRWVRLRDDGSSLLAEVPSWVMIKRLK